ncbi:hypothetical protein AJ85_04480 [Alkalihalobacillus alcalophilus ATCC 27647 = CGMCC 1.3604]|uniref:Uncharacterized protein n=1 Tax=Alkalihalobacillus alcalophilus ATCC 27647 = CGMCC 1.3604 TaxID=1218173 RepID=A0A094YUU4_ALKAL|nr:thioesterase family protein [Alkalihalobacillus alcalophilus]KGA97267.1 hypothetical protein BALCAV_0211215 [Alkalihalobacillus alcalophilus ATCC 27647 = CGMCC 1.3604]MED1562788.1 thioesterase family protein [Alkalihalobacillus alcalophilus]THG91526.1 hypothetical protein AJ85_04480 [Alkalihalobacillus alcalophilus ATCC 27647 = CGMCC 1.3604]
MKIVSTKIAVRYAETDQMGVVHHSNYVVWFEVGRTEFIKELGFSYAEMERDGILSPVIDLQVSYKQPTTYGEEVSIHTWVEEYDGIRVKYGYEVKNKAGQLCVTGNSVHVCVKKDNFRPISIRKTLPHWHEAYEKIKKK